MKRIISLLLVLSMIVTFSLGLVSCGGNANDTDNIGGSQDNDTPSGDTPSGDTPSGDTPSGDTPSGDTSSGDIPSGDTPSGDTPSSDTPSGDTTSGGDSGEHKHIDNDKNDKCDGCGISVVVTVDFYVLNDLHGKFCDTDTQPGVDELATYIKTMQASDDHSVVLSSGDMWQGTAESNLSRGFIITEWMNEMGFVSMTLGNHEFDWGEDAIRDNLEIADFPFLAINVYDNRTGKLADYCTPSIMIDRGDIQIGIIGAIGDCYSSISSDKVTNVHFKVGYELAGLVEAEAKRLRNAGADLIVYSLHDGRDSSSSGTSYVTSSSLQSYYAQSLSNGVVDLVFESHTHQSYTIVDTYGVYHLQAGGENKGISHVEISVNYANGTNKVTDAGVVSSYTYSSYADDEATEILEDKYSDVIDRAYSVLGNVSKYYDDTEVEAYVAELYLEAGLEKWGSQYDIVLGGGFLRTRSPYNLYSGPTTYAEILSLLPFDNEIVLCSISGYKLNSKFINSNSYDYYSAYSSYGNSVKGSISNNKTYYVVVDIYTAVYAPNGLTIVDYYDDSTYARDLFAEAVRDGKV